MTSIVIQSRETKQEQVKDTNFSQKQSKNRGFSNSFKALTYQTERWKKKRED